MTLGLRNPMNSIFEHKEELNYFDEFMLLSIQNRIFEITSIS